ANAIYARILWLNGRPEKASSIIRDTVESINHQSFAFGFFLVFAGCPVSFWNGDLEAVHRYLSMLLDFQAGIAFNGWQVAGRIYGRVHDFLSGTDRRSAADRNQLVGDPTLNPLHADHLSTFDWRLLCPGPLAQATAGTVNWCTAEVLRAQGE